MLIGAVRVRWSRVLVVTVVGGALALLAIAAAVVRPILASRARTKIEARAAQVFDRVELGTLELGRTGARIDHLHLGLGDSHGSIRDVRVGFSFDSVWRGRISIDSVQVGAVEFDVHDHDVAQLAERLAKRTGPRVRRLGRVRIGSDLRVDVARVQGTAHLRGNHLVGSGRVQVRGRRVDALARDITVTASSAPPVRLGAVASTFALAEGLSPQFPISIDLRGGTMLVSPRISVAAVDGTVVVEDPRAERVSAELRGRFGAGPTRSQEASKLWRASARVDRMLQWATLQLEAEAFSLGRVPEVLSELPLVDSNDAEIGGRLDALWHRGTLRLAARGHARGLNVAHPVLAPDPVRDLGVELDIAATLVPAQRRAVVHRVRVAKGELSVLASGAMQHGDHVLDRYYRLRLQVPQVECDQVLRELPTGLVPALAGFSLDGRFEADVRAWVDPSDLDSLALTGSVGIAGCRVRNAPAELSRLARGFVHRVEMPNADTRSIAMVPGHPQYASLHQISPSILAAVLTTEDGGFWRHRGFLPSQFEVALRRNLAAGRVRLGASTITMQMVKNVLLSHERTLSRKVQEMFLTWYVEQSLSKQRIMELYLNAIEYGPGLYGIRSAAHHYFGKEPALITPPEAAYLALMLPSPVKRYGQYCRGEPSKRFAAKIELVMRLMYERGRLSEPLYQAWQHTPVVFDLSQRGSEERCRRRQSAALERDRPQRALSGLLGEPGQRFPLGSGALGAPAQPGRDPELVDPWSP